MKQYINREKVLKTLDGVLSEVKAMADIPDNYQDGWEDGLESAINEIADIPVEAAKSECCGKWIETKLGLKCSRCGRYSVKDHLVPYCQWCGSKNTPEGGEII